MHITKSRLDELMDEMTEQRQRAINNANACAGALEILARLRDELEETEGTKD
jgi:hypothetical protein